jgi:hypothetical protein
MPNLTNPSANKSLSNVAVIWNPYISIHQFGEINWYVFFNGLVCLCICLSTEMLNCVTIPSDETSRMTK